MGRLDDLSDMLNTPWIKYSIILGLFAIVAALLALLLLQRVFTGNAQLALNIKSIVANYGLIGVFFATILAGTVVPLGSPALVAAAVLFGLPKIPIILVATMGFTIGITINYGLGYYLGRPYVAKKVAADKLADVIAWWNKWGLGLYLLFGLIPVLPVELLSLVCGILKTRLDYFLAISFSTRLIVFAVFAYFGELASNWIGLI